VSPHLESEFGMRSPRVVRVPLVDPSKVTNNTVTFSNIGLFFIESATPGPNGEITGRFLYYVPGTPDGGGGPSRLIRYVRLTGCEACSACGLAAGLAAAHRRIP